MSSGEEKLEETRKKIDEIDDDIVDLLLKRMQYAAVAKREKKRMNMPIRDSRREEAVVEKWRERARRKKGSSKYALSDEMMELMAKLIIEYTIKNEMEE